MKHPKFEITPGGWLLLSVLYFFGDWEGVLVLLGSAAIHEWGHLSMLRRFGVSVRRMTLDGSGLCIYCFDGLLNRRKQFAVAAAGPMYGLAGSVICSVIGNVTGQELWLLMAGAGAVLSGFNMLPVKPLDGWRMLRAVWPQGPFRVSRCTAVLVMLAGLAVMYLGYGTVLAFMGIVLVLQNGDSYCKINNTL